MSISLKTSNGGKLVIKHDSESKLPSISISLTVMMIELFLRINIDEDDPVDMNSLRDGSQDMLLTCGYISYSDGILTFVSREIMSSEDEDDLNLDEVNSGKLSIPCNKSEAQTVFTFLKSCLLKDTTDTDE